MVAWFQESSLGQRDMWYKLYWSGRKNEFVLERSKTKIYRSSTM